MDKEPDYIPWEDVPWKDVLKGFTATVIFCIIVYLAFFR